MLARKEWRIERNRNIYIVESHISGLHLIYVNITKYALGKKGGKETSAFSFIWLKLLNLFFI